MDAKLAVELFLRSYVERKLIRKKPQMFWCCRLSVTSYSLPFCVIIWNKLNQRVPWISLWLLFICVCCWRTRSVSKVDISQLAASSAASPAAHHWPGCSYRRLQIDKRRKRKRSVAFFSQCVWLHLCCERGCATRLRWRSRGGKKAGAKKIGHLWSCSSKTTHFLFFLLTLWLPTSSLHALFL